MNDQVYKEPENSTPSPSIEKQKKKEEPEPIDLFENDDYPTTKSTYKKVTYVYKQDKDKL